MTGFLAFLRKEFTEIVRTWRIWVIPGMLLFFGLISPIIAALTPALVQSMASAQPGVVVKLPPPTALDAAAQFLKNLNQFILIAIVIAGAGVVSGERGFGDGDPRVDEAALARRVRHGEDHLANHGSRGGHHTGHGSLRRDDGGDVPRRARRPGSSPR